MAVRMPVRCGCPCCGAAEQSAWLVSPFTYGACAGSAVRVASMPLVQLGSVACLSTLVPLCAWLVSPGWFLCARGLSLHTGSSVLLASLPLVQLGGVACLSILISLCACLVSPHWLLCAHGLSLHTGSSVRAASLPHVQLGRAWLIPPSSYDARGVSASCAAGARLAYPSLVL